MALYGFRQGLGTALAPQGSLGPFGVVDTTIETGVHTGESVGVPVLLLPTKLDILSNGFLSSGLGDGVSWPTC